MFKKSNKTSLVLCSMVACAPGWVAAGDVGDAAGVTEIAKAAPGVLKAERPIPGEYNVVFKSTAVSPSLSGVGTVDGATTNLATTLASQYGVGIITTWSSALQGMAMSATAAQAEALAKDSRVAIVQENGEVHLEATQTGATWGLDRVDQRNLPLDTFYNYSTDASNVTAYIIDTGIRTTHGQFGGRASDGYDAIDGSLPAADCNGHGTHVAGTVGGSGYGVAKGVKLKAVRVLDCAGSGTWTQVINGVNWVAANRVLPAVANMSLGGSYYAPLNTAVQGAIGAGVTFAIAAGNSNANACSYSPASTANAITVGATTSADARASYSNYGTCLDIFAPGSSITSAWYTSDTATNTISGTSMATPHVAGAAALYLASNPAATPAQVATALINASTLNKVTSPGTGSPNRLLYTGAIGPADTTPPTATLTAPTAGQTLSGTAVTLSANATDNVAVAKVEFYAGSTLIGTDTTTPYSVAWNSTNIANGSYSFTAKATDTAGNTKTSTAVVATVSNAVTACSTTSQLVLNPGFESGAASWTATAGVIGAWGSTSRTGSYSAWLDGYGTTHTDTLYQTVSIPSNACTADFSFWVKITTAETTTTTPYDKLTVAVQNSSGTTLGTLATYSNLNASTGYVQKTFSLLAYKGQTVRLYFQGIEDSTLATSFFVDDVALTIKK